MSYLRPKTKELIKRILIYAVMVLAIIASVTFITLFVLGFRVNIGDGQVEQYAFLQFDSTPSGAVVRIDDVTVGSKTPNKISVKPGTHTITMKKNGYKTWTKTLSVGAGTLTWLNYTLFIPQDLIVEPILTYGQVYSSSTSPESHSMLIQYSADIPSYDLVDLDSAMAKVSKITLPSNVYTGSATDGLSHDFQTMKWDDDGRYVLLRHTFGENNEWIVLDTQNVSLSKNITKMFDIAITAIDFSGTSGNSYFVIESGDIRKLDLAGGTMSKVLVSNVSSIFVYGTNIIAYIGQVDESGDRSIGIYRNGDDLPYIIKTTKELAVEVSTSHYFKKDYIAYSEGDNVTVLGGSYVSSAESSADNLKLITSFETTGDVSSLSFSPSGEYILAQSGTSFSSYDLEYQKLSTVASSCAGTDLPKSWLDDSHIWSGCSGNLKISDFDGSNSHTINSILSGQSAALTHNGKYIYSINKTKDATYQLQRVGIILP